MLARDAAAPRQFSIALSFQRPEGERVRQGRFACRYGQTASGAVAIQALELATVARRFRAVRRERGAYAIYVDDEPRPRGKGPQLAPERSIALPAEALALLGPDSTHLQDLSLALRRELEGIVYLGPLRRRPERDYVWNKTAPGDVGNDGHQAIDALLANALLPSEHQGSVLRSVSHWLQRMGMAEQLSVRAVGRSGRYELLVHHDGVVANLRDVGVGVSQVLPVLAWRRAISVCMRRNRCSECVSTKNCTWRCWLTSANTSASTAWASGCRWISGSSSSTVLPGGAQ